jgi:hypothetical protein
VSEAVIWITPNQFLAAVVGLSIALCIANSIWGEPQGPADTLATSFGLCFFALILLIAASQLPRLFGYEIGIVG